jgi:hypothetical protein
MQEYNVRNITLRTKMGDEVGMTELPNPYPSKPNLEFWPILTTHPPLSCPSRIYGLYWSDGIVIGDLCLGQQRWNENGASGIPELFLGLSSHSMTCTSEYTG